MAANAHATLLAELKPWWSVTRHPAGPSGPRRSQYGSQAGRSGGGDEWDRSVRYAPGGSARRELRAHRETQQPRHPHASPPPRHPGHLRLRERGTNRLSQATRRLQGRRSEPAQPVAPRHSSVGNLATVLLRSAGHASTAAALGPTPATQLIAPNDHETLAADLGGSCLLSDPSGELLSTCGCRASGVSSNLSSMQDA
jgi:hypothetical protein